MDEETELRDAEKMPAMKSPERPFPKGSCNLLP